MMMKRLAEAFELRGEHQVDDDDGEPEGQGERVAFLAREAGFADVVFEEARSASLRAAAARMAARPSLAVTPKAGSAESVAEFSWLNCSIATGPASVSDAGHRRERDHRVVHARGRRTGPGCRDRGGRGRRPAGSRRSCGCRGRSARCGFR